MPEAFRERLVSGSYDVASNGNQLASAFRMIEDCRKRADEEVVEETSKFQALIDASSPRHA